MEMVIIMQQSGETELEACLNPITTLLRPQPHLIMACRWSHRRRRRRKLLILRKKKPTKFQNLEIRTPPFNFSIYMNLVRQELPFVFCGYLLYLVGLVRSSDKLFVTNIIRGPCTRGFGL